MVKHYLVILLFLTLSLSAQIKLTSSLPNQSTFPQLNSKITFKPTIQNEQRTQIIKIIKGWVLNYDQNIRGTTSKIHKNDGSSKRCQTSYFQFQQKISQITRIYTDSNSLIPTNIIKLVNPFNFGNGIIPVYVPEQKRNPFNITIFNGINASFINLANHAAYKNKISELIIKNSNILNSIPIQVHIAQSTNIQKVIRELGLSSKIYEQLTIASSNPNQISPQGKIVIVLFQKFFSSALNFSTDSEGASASLFETIFNKKYDRQDLFQSSAWGPGFIPHTIVQTNYGRLLVLSVDSNFRNERIIQRLQTCLRTVDIGYVCFQSAMKQVRSIPTLRFYVGGVDPNTVTQQLNGNYYKETINWKKVFFDINQKSVELIRPLSARMMNILGKKYFQTQNRYFSIPTCKKAAMQVKIKTVIGQISAGIGKDQNNFGPIVLNTNKAETIDVDSIWQTFFVRFVLEGTRQKKKWYSFKDQKYQRQLELSIIMDGQVKLTKIIGNKKDNQKQQVFTIQIDTRKGVASQ